MDFGISFAVVLQHEKMDLIYDIEPSSKAS